MRAEQKQIVEFQNKLILEEKSAATIEKYLRDVRAFFIFIGEREITKEQVLVYKRHLEEENYAVRSINSMLASVNKFLEMFGLSDCKVKSLKLQRQVYCDAEKEEYVRLLNAAKPQKQLHLILQTICGTGIRVSELKYFTVEAVKNGEINVYCKAKTRRILIPGKLRKMLLGYAKANHITDGPIFVTRHANIMDRSNIWAQMKRLCEAAKVKPSKVFPHNLRKLFARTFYKVEKDIVKLADILGHSHIETTRIYIMTTGTEHRRKIERLGFVI